MDHDLYTYRPDAAGDGWWWPGGARVAVVVCLQVEASIPELPPGEWVPPGTPAWLDVSAWSLLEYGRRVGVFRLGSILDDLGIRATMPVSDRAMIGADGLIGYAAERGWEFVGHGAAANRLVTSAMSESEEESYLAASRAAITAATGTPPRGWAGPEMSESWRTPEVAARLGYEYVLDWGNDDRPYPFLTADPLISVPQPVDTSDHLVLAAGSAQTPWDHAATVAEHAAFLCREATPGSVLTMSLRAHLSGQPFRARYIRELLSGIVERPEVWVATASEVADAYRAIRPPSPGGQPPGRPPALENLGSRSGA